MSFGQRLRDARRQANLTQIDLGKGLGDEGEDVSAQTVSGWEKDHHYPRISQLAVICERLDVTADWLVLGRKSPESVSQRAMRLAQQFDQLPRREQDPMFVVIEKMFEMAAERAQDQRNTAPVPIRRRG